MYIYLIITVLRNVGYCLIDKLGCDVQRVDVEAQWLSPCSRQMLRRSVRLLKEDTEAGVVLSLLLSTAILERSLGDVSNTLSSKYQCFTMFHRHHSK